MLTRARTAIGPSLVLVLGSSACTERLIRDRLCGDGRLSRGEICLGEGDRTSLSVDTLAPLSIRLADFTGDARPDLLVMGLDPSGAVAGQLWPGDGEGSFSAPLDPSVYGCSAHPVPGSIDDDPFADLLVDDCDLSVSLFRGTESGVFEPPLTVFTGATTRSSSLLDLDEDGQREVVLFGTNGDGVSVLSVTERTDAGSFAPPVLSPLILPGDFVSSGFGYFDDDPLLDVLLLDSGTSDGLALTHGLPDLRFSEPRRLASPPGLLADFALPRDLDDDGRAEVLVGAFEAQALVALELDGDTLSEQARTELPGLSPGPIAIADLDDDGHADFLRVDAEAAQLHAWRGTDDAEFEGPTPVDLDEPVDQLALADLNRDGALDVVIGSFEQSRIHVLLTDP